MSDKKLTAEQAISEYQNMPTSEKIQTALTVMLLTWKKILDVYDRDAPAGTAYRQASEMVRNVLLDPNSDPKANGMRCDKSAAVLFALLDSTCLAMLAADPKLTAQDFVDALLALEKDFAKFVDNYKKEETNAPPAISARPDRKAN